jgi:dTDP-glucose 4,6-dehydratase
MSFMTFSSILVTGGCGFIGANFVRLLLERKHTKIVVLDKLTYAGRLENLAGVNVPIVIGDIGNLELVRHLVETHKIDLIINFAAETHVDQSILNPFIFTQTNVQGTHVLLEVAREKKIRFHQISTDEVYGTIEGNHHSLETDILAPRSPYSASKAAADQLVQSYFVTYGLQTTITRGSNNVGAYQFLEKVVPLFATNALLDLPLPVYGDGLQMRDYTHVTDHCTGILAVLEKGTIGEVYNVGAGQEITNMAMLEVLLDTLGKPRSLIRHVTDRAGHDRRYSVSVKKLEALGWQAKFAPKEAVAAAVSWYMDNPNYWTPVRESPNFQAYYNRQYAKRLEVTA